MQDCASLGLILAFVVQEEEAAAAEATEATKDSEKCLVVEHRCKR